MYTYTYICIYIHIIIIIIIIMISLHIDIFLLYKNPLFDKLVLNNRRKTFYICLFIYL